MSVSWGLAIAVEFLLMPDIRIHNKMPSLALNNSNFITWMDQECNRNKQEKSLRFYSLCFFHFSLVTSGRWISDVFKNSCLAASFEHMRHRLDLHYIMSTHESGTLPSCNQCPRSSAVTFPADQIPTPGLHLSWCPRFNSQCYCCYNYVSFGNNKKAYMKLDRKKN